MEDPFEGPFFKAIERVSSSPASFSGMIEFYMQNHPKRWLEIVKYLMEFSQRNLSSAQSLGMELEIMIDQYARHMRGDNIEDQH